MADVSDNEELIATRKLHGLDDNLFKEEIEVGEYVRTKKGAVGKLIEIDKKAAAYYLDCLKCVSLKNIVKHSKQLIDLIECGDYVNGKLIHKIDKGPNYCYLYYGNCKTFVDYQIQTILTKEQIAANCYKVGGEDEF